MEIVYLRLSDRTAPVSEGLSFSTSWLAQNSCCSLDSRQGKLLIATAKPSKNRKATSSVLNVPTELQSQRLVVQVQQIPGLQSTYSCLQTARSGMALHKYLLIFTLQPKANSPKPTSRGPGWSIAECTSQQAEGEPERPPFFSPSFLDG